MSPSISLILQREIREAANCYSQLLSDAGDLEPIMEKLVTETVQALKDKKQVAFCGNGGSFADAQHMAAEFTGKLGRDRAPISGTVLGSNSSSMSAIGNDFGFEMVFARELEAFSNQIGLVVAFSTSGSSKNIIELGKVAKRLGKPLYCFTGSSGGPISEYATLIKVPSMRTERIQELHTTLGHLFCLLVEEELEIV